LLFLEPDTENELSLLNVDANLMEVLEKNFETRFFLAGILLPAMTRQLVLVQ
jgi:hypothetical protein